MTNRTPLDLGFIETVETRWEVTDALSELTPAVADAFAVMFYRHMDQTDALLKLAKDAGAAKALNTLAKRVKPHAEAFGGSRRLVVTVLTMTLSPTGAPSKAALGERLNHRHKAASTLRTALANLEQDDAVLDITLPELMRHGQNAADDGIRSRATDALKLMHKADGDMEGNLMHAAPTLRDILSVLADRMERDAPMDYTDITQSDVPIPQDGRETRDKLWIERRLEALFREYTGGPQYECIADVEAVLFGIETDAEQVKARLGKARRGQR